MRKVQETIYTDKETILIGVHKRIDRKGFFENRRNREGDKENLKVVTYYVEQNFQKDDAGIS